MNRSRRNEARYFNENSPRPPVPGEETESYVGRYRSQSPALTPRRSALGCHVASSSCDASAPLGFEPEGSCGIMETNSPPACLRWARSIQSLLLDREGLHLFRNYVTEEGNQYDIDVLEFWLACVGLKEPQNADKTSQLVKAIYRRYIVKAQLEIPEDVKKETKRRLKETWPEENIFDNAQLEAEHLMARTSYPNFLRSDMFLQYVQACQNPEQGGGCPSSSSSRDISLSCGPSLLPTLHEDTEYHPIQHISRSACDTPNELRLTKDVLMATQKTRALDVRPKPEAFAGMYLQPGTSPYHMSSKVRVQYSSYNPVSRQDSELQSLSSDARTESDNLSITDSSVDGMSTGRSKSSKKQYLRHSRAIKESASLNRDPLLHSVIPRTDRAPRELTKPPKPEIFAQELAMRLEILKRDREHQEKVEKLTEDSFVDASDCSISASGTGVGSTDTTKNLADALCQKLSIDDGNDQDILDQHVSRVWSDPTPSRSPGIVSPKSAGHNYSRSHKQRKDKDGYSTFSIDSGNIHDFAEGDFAGASSLSSSTTHLPKSKSVPSEFADSLHKPDLYLQGQDQRFRRSDMSRRSATKKSLTELTDSGVSVISDVTAASKDCRMQWRNQIEKKNELKHMRHGKKYGSRSGSLERANREEWGGRAQPFLGDPGMPLLPQPHIPTQLEEAKRRLLEEDRARGGSASSMMYPGPSSAACSSGFNRRILPAYKQQSHEPVFSSQQHQQPQQCPHPSNQSTLRKSRHDIRDFTTVVFNFCDEQFPYRTKIPGHNVTLKQFKEYLPKKGSYRYFFKTECEDLDTKVIQEEITDDSEVLPLWEGKVMAQVKALE